MKQIYQGLIKKRTVRDRYYSSMTYDQYCQFFGPLTPHFKPQQDPTQDIPQLQLEEFSENEVSIHQEQSESQQQQMKMFTPYRIHKIEEVEESDVHSKYQKCVLQKLFLSNKSCNVSTKHSDASKTYKSRQRAQSGNSQYLIFNFLQRAHKKASKKIKVQ